MEYASVILYSSLQKHESAPLDGATVTAAATELSRHNKPKVDWCRMVLHTWFLWTLVPVDTQQ